MEAGVSGRVEGEGSIHTKASMQTRKIGTQRTAQYIRSVHLIWVSRIGIRCKMLVFYTGILKKLGSN